MSSTKRLVQSAVLVSLALALSYIERFIPLQLLVPLPGVKLGLANVVTLIALYLLGTKSAFAILILRCVMGAVFGGGITGLAFSLTGGILSMSVMSLCKNIPFLSVYGVSILGAAAHNIGQILAAMVLMNSVYISAYLPYLLIAAIVTGLLTGGVCARILQILPKASVSVPAQMGK